jgi:hypothetical protein
LFFSTSRDTSGHIEHRDRHQEHREQTAAKVRLVGRRFGHPDERIASATGVQRLRKTGGIPGHIACSLFAA